MLNIDGKFFATQDYWPTLMLHYLKGPSTGAKLSARGMGRGLMFRTGGQHAGRRIVIWRRIPCAWRRGMLKWRFEGDGETR